MDGDFIRALAFVVGQVGLNRLLQVELALLAQLENQDGGGRFRDRSASTPKLPSAMAATRKSDMPIQSVSLRFASNGCAQGAGLDQSRVPEGRAGLGTMRTVAG